MHRVIPLLPLPLLGACSGVQSALDPAGPSAAAVATVWWLMFWGALLVLALVTALALYAVYRRPDRRRQIAADRLIIAGGIVLPSVTLTTLLVYGFNAGTLAGEPDPLRVEVIGHRWWWEFRYPGAEPAVTANELHIPAGRQVELTLRSAGVIHSFWVPQLAGKADLIPGQTNSLRLQADTAGAFRGQCAEFCGVQHAHMAFWVIAEPAERFDAWLQRQREPAREPASPPEQRGRALFLANRCVECHTVRGTAARGDVGPDLTHVGSRRTIAAGTLANDGANLRRWIAHNQLVKPGNRMLSFAHLGADEVAAIAAYLGSLR